MNSPPRLRRLAGLPLSVKVTGKLFIIRGVACHLMKVSLTLPSILAGSVTNRVMAVELGLPVILAGLFGAIPASPPTARTRGQESLPGPRIN